MAGMVSITFKSATDGKWVTNRRITSTKWARIEPNGKQRISAPYSGIVEGHRAITIANTTHEPREPRLPANTNRPTKWHSASSLSGHDVFTGLHYFQHTQGTFK